MIDICLKKHCYNGILGQNYASEITEIPRIDNSTCSWRHCGLLPHSRSVKCKCSVGKVIISTRDGKFSRTLNIKTRNRLIHWFCCVLSIIRESQLFAGHCRIEEACCRSELASARASSNGGALANRSRHRAASHNDDSRWLGFEFDIPDIVLFVVNAPS
jgi:hypothetical protein